MTMEALPQDLADFLVTKNFDPEYFDDKGQPAEAGDAKTMKFDYVAATGKNYGTAVIVVADNELSLFYGDNLGRGMDPDDKQEWFEFLEQLSNKAASHSATWSPRDINQLKHTLAGIAAIKEGLFEGYYGNRRVSYMGEQTQARLVINHNRVLGEEDKRFRYVESLFIETADQERFRLGFKSLAGGRAMLEHVRQGGRPYDVRGNHITEIVSEMAVLSRFNRAQHRRVYEGVTQELVESARQYYHNLQETMKHLGSSRGYQAYFESWAPDQTGEAEALVENLRDLFVEQTLDARIEAALPTLAKIQQQGNNMKEAQIFENWINNLSEGTWALPETPEQMEKLNQLMSAELIVGPDATNATELLNDIVGDADLFEILENLADNDPRANIWDDSDVQARLAELGIQTPQSTQDEPADVPQDTAPAVKEDQLDEIGDTPAGKDALRAVQNRAYDTMDAWSKNSASGFSATPKQVKKATGAATAAGNRLHGFGPDRMKQDTVMARDALRKQLSVAEGLDGYEPIAHAIEQYITNHYNGKHGLDTDDFMKVAGMVRNGSINSARKFASTLDTDPRDKLLNMLGQGMAEDSSENKYSNLSNRGVNRGINRAGDDFNRMLDLDQVESPHYKTQHQQDTKQRLKTKPMAGPKGTLPEQAMGEGDNMSTFEQDHELAEMLKYAGVPVKESVLTDSTGNKMEHIKDIYKRDIKDFTETGDMSDALYDALYDYYFDDMPYGTKKARDGDPHEWISDRFAQDIGLDEGWKGALAGGLAGAGLGSVVPGLGTLAGGIAGAYAGHKIGDQGISDPTPAPNAPGAAAPQRNAPIKMTAADRLAMPSGPRKASFQKPIAESSCNMTMEGSYCPEHGLAECGGMYEGTDDPINSNSAMTGSYYEGKETDIQEGDALLARIKSLALLR